MKPFSREERRRVGRRAGDDVLRRSEERYRELVERASDGVFTADADGCCTDVNAVGCRMLGYAREEIVGRAISDLFSPADQIRVLNAEEQLQKEGVLAEECRLRRKDGSYVPVDVTAEVLADGRWLGVARDISQRKKLEKALRETMMHLSRAQAVAQTGSWYLDIPRNDLWWSDETYRLFGIPKGTPMTYELFLDVVHPDDRAHVDEKWQAALHRAPYDIEHRIVVGGNVRWVRERAELEFDPQGVPRGGIGTVQDITDQKRAEQALRESEERIRALLESVGEGVFGVDLAGNCTFVNAEGLRMFGYVHAREVLGKNMHALTRHSRADGSPCPPEACRIRHAYLNGAHFRVDDELFSRRDGTRFVAEYHSSPIIKDGKIAGAVATFTDISARKRAEEQLRQAAIVFQSTKEAVIITDSQKRIVTVNRAFTEMTGYQPSEVIGRDPRVLKSGRQHEDFYRRVYEILEQTDQWQGEIWDRRKNGEIFPAWENISIVRDDKGRVANYVAILSDISMIKQAEDRLRHLAHHDALTGLPNRLLFAANLDQALEQARRHRQSLALLFLDLDRFKLINDTLGHSVGDQLLEQVAQRLRVAVRSEDTVARLGGDEFTVIMTELRQAEDAALLAQKLIAAVNKPIVIGGYEMAVGVSIGISIFPNDGANRADLRKAADAALYRAKERGRGTYEFYTPELTASALDHLAMEQALRAALAREEFVLYYQPEVDLATGKIVRVEALLRWRHPQRGLLLPDAFMHVAEDSGLIEPIGEWVFRAACQQAVAWRAAGFSGGLAVNLSGRQVVRAGLVDKFEAILRETGAQPAGVEFELEITESVLHRVEQSRSVLERLKRLGARLAVDDFGAGYSSLTHLRHLPIDTLKIDRSFIDEAPRNPDARSIVEAIITLGHGLRLTVVGEGVETITQQEFLRALHCDYVQGYLYGRAVPVGAIEKILASGSVNLGMASEVG